jgi:2-polyprenyl-6-methoxyphenol hydroxylase-like FAD-dependent oxidoreductase
MHPQLKRVNTSSRMFVQQDSKYQPRSMRYPLRLSWCCSTAVLAVLRCSRALATAAAAAPRVAVVGGGPAGALAAIFLGKSGCTVNLYEARPANTIASASTRSYNTVIFPKGLAALEAAGIDLYAPEHSDIAVVIEGSIVHSSAGPSKGGGFSTGYISIERGALAQRLLDVACALPNVHVHYSSSLAGVDLQRRCVQLRRDGHAHLQEQVSCCRLVYHATLFLLG